MTGCGGHYGIDDPNPEVLEGSYIFFDAGVTATKGTLINDTTPLKTEGSSLGVLGFRPDGAAIFLNHTNNVAELTCSNDQFNYSPLALWHSGQHNFYAYYPYGSSTIDITGISDSRPYIAYTQPSTLQTMTDVMTASAEATSAVGEVELVFNHRLSALDLVVKNSQTESEREIKIKTAYIKLESIPSNGTLYFNGTTVPNKASFTVLEHTYDIASPITITYDNANKENSKHNLNSNNSFLFLPCDRIVATVTLTIINSWNEEVQLGITSQSLAPENGFVAGNRYYLIITKTEAGVEFRLDWANANGDWTNGPDSSFDFS